MSHIYAAFSQPNYSWSLFWFHLIMEGAPSRHQQISSIAFGNHSFGIPTIFEKDFSVKTKWKFEIIDSFLLIN